jgi:hypothetical protein
MTLGLLTLSLTYAAVLIVLVSLWLHSRHAAWLKLTLTVLVFALCLVTYQSFWRITGWPSSQALPERFLLLGVWVREPDDKSDPTGGIDLWAVEIGDAGPADHPRAFSLPYAKELHQRLQEAQRRTGQGRPQMGRQILEGGRRNNRGPMRLAPDQLTIEFYDLPDPALPEK